MHGTLTETKPIITFMYLKMWKKNRDKVKT